MNTNNPVFISQITLENFQERHILKTFEFIQLENVYSYFARNKKADFKTHKKYWQDSLKDKTQRSFAIYLGNIHIGNCGIKKIKNDGAEIWKYIADKNYLGKGYGKSATFLMMKKCFEELNLKRLYAVVDKTNIRNINLNKKFGFIEIEFNEADFKYWGKEISHLIKMKAESVDFYDIINQKG